jgi:peptide/nickel transport system substrate-binding protein
MEYVEGPTLAQALRRGPLPVARARKVLRGIASALDHAHAHGIIHRDVKPANILLGDDGRTKLADLGIAFVADHATQITRTGTVLGTPSYMAPEQLESREIGKEVDVYALGAVAFEVLSGRPARIGTTPVELAHRIANEPAPELREVWPEAPPGAAEALCAAMAADPTMRPSLAGALVERLEAALEGLDGDAEYTKGEWVAGRSVAPAGPSAAGQASAERGLFGARPQFPPGAAVRRDDAVADPEGSDDARLGGTAPEPEDPAPVSHSRDDTSSDAERTNTGPLNARAFPGDNDIRPQSTVFATSPEQAGVVSAEASGATPVTDAARASASRAPDHPTASVRPLVRSVGGSPRTRRRPEWLIPAAILSVLAVIAAIALLPSGGGGGTSDESGGRTVTRNRGSTPAGGGSAGAANSSPVVAVETFYRRAAADHYQGAWQLAGPRFRTQLGGFEAFRRGMSTLESISFPRAETVSLIGSSARVGVATVARHTHRTDRCQGTVQLTRTGAGWTIDGASIGCASGGSPPTQAQ